MKELRIFGPPGTGKSTRLATEEIPNAVEKFGPDRVVVTSFTKTGAEEIANKKSLKTGEAIPVDPAHVGTLHALCYRELGTPPIAETKKKEWNEGHPEYLMAGKDAGDLDEGGVEDDGGDVGDTLLNRLNILRAHQAPYALWKPDIVSFEKKWREFKLENGYLDFTDMIEQAMVKLPYAPGRPDVLFVDEAQDFTRLQLSLVRSWGAQARWIVLVGDDDQCLFSFAGANPDAFLRPVIDEKFKRVLGQSYRVPRTVFERANKIVNKISLREPKQYEPRDFEGAVKESAYSWKSSDDIVSDIEKYLSVGKSVMYLASCAYMLDPVKTSLKHAGIPFCNPYRIKRGDWNPLASGSRKRTTTTDVLIAFSSFGEDNGYWNVEQFLTWAKYLKVGPTGLQRVKGKAGLTAVKNALEKDPDAGGTSRHIIGEILSPDAINFAMERNFQWLIDNLSVRKVQSIEYPVKVLKKGGADALTKRPKLVIGTIHSVKGAEADIVILAPDISRKSYTGLLEVDTPEAKDQLYRLFYVGMTRAREELVLMRYVTQGGRAYYVDL